MFKTFILGIVLGIIGTGALLYFVPLVDEHREASLISVEPNGGNSEAFHINIPADRILSATDGSDSTTPGILSWPDNGIFANLQTGLFKIRNRDDVVVGVASRMTGPGNDGGSVIEWTLHLPARGSLYLTLQPAADAEGFHAGSMRAGTREFAHMQGRVRERFVGSQAAPAAGSARDGRIELVTKLVAVAVEGE